MYHDRLARLKERMAESNLDAVVLTSEPNMLYLSGYSAISLERLLSLIVFREHERACLILPRLEESRAEESCRIPDVEFISYSDVEDPVAILKEVLARNRVKNLGVEGVTPYRFIHPLISSQPAVNPCFIDETMYSLRVIKDDEEIRTLEKAAEINNRLMVDAISHIEAGSSEKRLSAFVRSRALELGADEVAFTLIQAGPNSALPHQEPTEKKINKGEIVLLDIGIRYRGYYSDITRTVTFGEPTQQQRKIFDTVYQAQAAALAAAKEGVKAEAVDAAARRRISEAGYGEHFIHRTGHGLGLEVHEPPYIKEGNITALARGMAFTVEPGIYLVNKFGVRLEDNIVISDEGHINLTKLPKSLSIREYV
ncbi:MAG: Xaa-Pro peptidase family protein [Nitrososphaerota archaeon]|nr:Xaa-Pro peptidase family protein [Candidatus Calditenuaceae archaeon]MDW8072892.1 Xaa-Pro peptidase family protein [Nitrososphaerota archaeon]